MKALNNFRTNAGRLQKYFLVAVLAAFLASCDAGNEVTPEIEIAEDMEATNSFVSSLAIHYYGEKINLYQKSMALVGPTGTVDYDLFQPKEYEGTSLAEVTFFLNSGDHVKFSNINYKVLADLNKRSIEDIVEAVKDGEEISSTNLILILGSW